MEKQKQGCCVDSDIPKMVIIRKSTEGNVYWNVRSGGTDLKECQREAMEVFDDLQEKYPNTHGDIHNERK